jgi:hypothetical protein
MKPFACKCLFILPVILFVDYLILVAFGVTSGFFNAGEEQLGSAYLPVALMLIAASLVFFVGLITQKNKKEICDADESAT